MSDVAAPESRDASAVAARRGDDAPPADGPAEAASAPLEPGADGASATALGSTSPGGPTLEDSDAEPPAATGARAEHEERRRRYEADAASRELLASRLSMIQLGLFLGSSVFGGSGLMRGSVPMIALGGGLFAAFLIVRLYQGRVLARRDTANTRAEIHARHVLRIRGRLAELPAPAATLPVGHPYASDLDITGEASLLTRIDTTHTSEGAKTLTGWLGSPATADVIAERQAAVVELAGRLDLREELEAAVLDTGRERLDAGPFVAMMGERGLLEEKPWLKFIAPILPAISVTLGVLGQLAILPEWVWLLPLAVQIGVVRMTEPRCREVYKAMGNKKGFVDGYARLFEVVEEAKLEAPMTVRLADALIVGGAPPSAQLRRLNAWVAWFELREQGIVHFFVNPLLLWDLNCLIGIERWIRDVGRACGVWFELVGQLEALASLSVLLHQDPGARLPQIVGRDEPFVAAQIAHPLLPAAERVANDVSLRGPGTCLIVTGSNMAGKSTLLRAVGVNIALALAGGPVVAESLRIPRVRLRASMRIADSLQTGASYFQAELSRLRLVVSNADDSPPIFFLLDELLRGTNARARHIGARAVVAHLLARGGMGFVATHDVALSRLEQEQPEQVGNVHFTDVIDRGVMTFDYHLREGVVRTSNALRLLAQVGIDVDPELSLEGAESEAQSLR